jgi:uncharacterized iron-regulated protein
MLLLAGCAGGIPGGDDSILDMRTGRWIGRAELLRELQRADYVLLGETHDNPHHHRLQAELLDALSPARPALAMEMFDTGDQPGLDAARAKGVDADGLAKAGAMDTKSWRWDMYRPLVAIAVERGLPLAAANLSREGARNVMRTGWAALPDAARLDVEGPWNPKREATLGEEIRIAHCGEFPDSLMPGMVRAQRARDAVMADVLLRYPRAVLIAGRGHARSDYGVPIYLRQRAPGAKVLSVGFTERAPGDPISPRDTAAFDYVWPTPPAERPDQCASLAVNPSPTPTLPQGGGRTTQ